VRNAPDVPAKLLIMYSLFEGPLLITYYYLREMVFRMGSLDIKGFDGQ
jgi:hypothetical protein